MTLFFQLSFAAARPQATFTFSKGDFYQLHTHGLKTERDSAGFNIFKQMSTGVIVRRLLRLIDKPSAQGMNDRLKFRNDWRQLPQACAPNIAWGGLAFTSSMNRTSDARIRLPLAVYLATIWPLTVEEGVYVV